VKRSFSYASRLLLVLLGLVASACTDNSGNGAGNPGAGGSSAGGSAGTTGSGGTGGGGTAGSGTGGSGTPGFMSVLPCTSESQYVTVSGDGGPPTVNFPTSPTDFSYNPKCLTVPAGTTVTFAGDFATHPLFPSTHRGAQTGSPITIVSGLPDGGTTKDFTFSTPGFYAYFCAEHDLNDTGNFMDGVVWVQ